MKKVRWGGLRVRWSVGLMRSAMRGQLLMSGCSRNGAASMAFCYMWWWDKDSGCWESPVSAAILPKYFFLKKPVKQPSFSLRGYLLTGSLDWCLLSRRVKTRERTEEASAAASRVHASRWCLGSLELSGLHSCSLTVKQPSPRVAEGRLRRGENTFCHTSCLFHKALEVRSRRAFLDLLFRVSKKIPLGSPRRGQFCEVCPP